MEDESRFGPVMPDPKQVGPYQLIGSSQSSVSQQERKRAKQKADHDWYMRHVGQKKAYNEEYYDNNRDYWRNRYLKMKRKMADASSTSADREQLVIADINRKRAEKEYQEFMDSQSRVSIIDAWSIGAKSIVDIGRDFIQRLARRKIDRVTIGSDPKSRIVNLRDEYGISK